MMQRILVTGVSGFLGSVIARFLVAAGHDVVGTWHQHRDRVPRFDASAAPAARDQPPGRFFAESLDLSDGNAIAALVTRVQPHAVVHTAAIPDLRTCEAQPDLAHRINVEATAALARATLLSGGSGRACTDRPVPRRPRFVFTSTDQVFDGTRPWLRENDPVCPVHVYGRTKVEAEERLLQIAEEAGDTAGGAAVLRVCLVYGRSPSGRRSASEQVGHALDALLKAAPRARPEPDPPRLFVDEFRTPVLVDDVAQAVAELVAREGGLHDIPRLHLGGPERVSRYDLGVAVARAMGVSPAPIVPASLRDIDWNPPRPADLSLDTSLARRVLRHPPRPLAEGLALAVVGSTGAR